RELPVRALRRGAVRNSIDDIKHILTADRVNRPLAPTRDELALQIRVLGLPAAIFWFCIARNELCRDHLECRCLRACWRGRRARLDAVDGGLENMPGALARFGERQHRVAAERDAPLARRGPP